MSYTYQDALHQLGAKESGLASENWNTGNVKMNEQQSKEVISRYFPYVTLSKSQEVAYFPAIMCSSFPTVNKRGRMFSGKTLANSCDTARHSLANYNHQMQSTGYSSDKIIGHIVESAIGVAPELAGEIAITPESPIPFYILTALWRRNSTVQEIMTDQANAPIWQTSMECGHDWTQAVLRYEGEDIPFKDAESGMLECIGRTSVKRYKDKEIAIFLGGLNGKVDFHGVAYTVMPADNTTKVYSLYTARPAEAASESNSGMGLKVKSFGLDSEAASLETEEDKLEYVSGEVEKFLHKEVATVEVIGETNPSEGDIEQHTHKVLSNGQVMPALGHTHWFEMSVIGGSKPRVTGVTNTEHQRLFNDDHICVSESIHSHLIDISLRPARKARSSPSGEPDESANVPSDDITEESRCFLPTLSLLGDPSMSNKPKSNEVASLLDEITDALGETNPSVASKIAKIRTRWSESATEETIQSRVKEEVQRQVIAGDLFTKTDHEEAVAAAVEGKKEEIAAELRAEQKLATRREKLTSLGHKPEDPIPGIENAGTIGEYVDNLTPDTAGELQFGFLLKALGSKTDNNGGNNGGKKSAQEIAIELADIVTPSNGGGNGGDDGNDGGKKIGKHRVSKVAG